MKQEDRVRFRDLTIDLSGVKIRNPVGVGSIGFPCINPEKLTHEMHAEVLLKHVEAGAGFICLPNTCHVPNALLSDLEKKAKQFPSLRRSVARPVMFMRAGKKSSDMYNITPSPLNNPRTTATKFQRDTSGLIQKLIEKKPKDVPIIGNLGGFGSFPESFVSGAKALEESKVDLIELNLSSPASLIQWEIIDSYFEKNFPLAHVGFFLGDQPDLVENVVREVVKAVSIPVGVKVSPETGFPRIIDLARRIKAAGASFITCSNFGITVLAPDIYNRGKSKWPNVDGNPFVMIAGDWLRTIVYKQVAAIAKFVPGIDIIACGGILTPEQVVEAMMLGAKAIQMVTPVLYSGRKLIQKDIRFLSRYMHEQGYHSLDELVGLGLQYIKPASEIHVTYDKKSLYANVDTEKCAGCGICTDSICLSLHMKDSLAEVEIEKCIGCGMCVTVCPHDAIYLT